MFAENGVAIGDELSHSGTCAGVGGVAGPPCEERPLQGEPRAPELETQQQGSTSRRGPREGLWRRAVRRMFPYGSCISQQAQGAAQQQQPPEERRTKPSGKEAKEKKEMAPTWKVTKADKHMVSLHRDEATGIQTVVISDKDAPTPTLSTSPTVYPGGLVQKKGAASGSKDVDRLVTGGVDSAAYDNMKDDRAPVRKRPFEKSEEELLEETAKSNKRITSPFLTLFRKKSARPVLQPWAHLMSILDNSYDGIAKCLLNTVDRWAFNTFTLDTATCGHSLPFLMVHLLGPSGYDLLRTFRIEPLALFRFLGLVEAGYHVSNPYHNAVHAADVTQAMHCFLREGAILQHLTPIEILSALLAAVTHDLDHPGVNQQFLIETKNHLAALYNKSSVLENHHWRCAIACLQESGCLSQLDDDSWKKVQTAIKSLILATDITRQQEFILRFQRYMESESLDMTDYEIRHFILQIALKCADLCNPCRPWDTSLQWSIQVCKEFYRQGDYERRLRIPVTPICDRHKTIIPKIQVDFFKFVAYPLFVLWHEFLKTDLSQELLLHLKLNYTQWEKRIQRATQKGSLETDINAPLASSEEDLSVLGEEDADHDQDDDSLCSLNKTSIDVSLLEATSFSAGTWGRRHSMPLQLSKYLPKPLILRRRRQSLPNRHPSHRWSVVTSPQGRRGSDSALGQAGYSGYSCSSASASGSRFLPDQRYPGQPRTLSDQLAALGCHGPDALSDVRGDERESQDDDKLRSMHRHHLADPTRRRSESFLDDEDELSKVLRRSEEAPNLFLDVPDGGERERGERGERGHSYSSDASSCCSDGVHCGTPPLNEEDSSDRLCSDGLHCEEDLAPTAWSHRLSEVVEEPASPPPQRMLNRRSSAPIVLALVSSSSSSSNSNASSRRQSGDVRRGSLPVDVHLMAGCAAQLLNKQVAQVAIPEVPLGTTPGARRGSCPVNLSAKYAE
ncbi:uncharacterized protein LOC111259157 isoform X2 [Varroa jacobsoni]|uniref:uncharacterized protein LOC111259157 isoform X2 n=1 Tax=Varroa jacobsoni TaxID=62625 RepID=UPI000BF8FB4E|nr:uncharacterized protein LOC111259157 isoform X2 [Varroa jacobsoni]